MVRSLFIDKRERRDRLGSWERERGGRGSNEGREGAWVHVGWSGGIGGTHAWRKQKEGGEYTCNNESLHPSFLLYLQMVKWMQPVFSAMSQTTRKILSSSSRTALTWISPCQVSLHLPCHMTIT